MWIVREDGAVLVAAVANADGRGGELRSAAGRHGLAHRVGGDDRQHVRRVFHLPAKDEVPLVAAVTVNREVIFPVLDRVETNAAGEEAAAVLVARFRGEERDVRAPIDAKQRVEIAAAGADGSDAGDGSGPGVPNGFAAGFAGVLRLTRLARGALVRAGGQPARSGKRHAIIL